MNQRLLITALISTIIVIKIYGISPIFLIADFLKLLSFPRNPHIWGALLVMSLQVTLHLMSSSFSFGNFTNNWRSLAAERKVDPLLDIMIYGNDRLAANL